jgi:YD repeat-containing protein
VGLSSTIQWEPFGAAKSWQWQLDSGPQAHERSYDTSGRLVRYRLGSVIRDIHYDAADRIGSYVHHDAISGTAQTQLDQSFGHDELGRLTGITTAATSWAITYDANGNRVSVTQSGSTRAYTTAATSNRLTNLSNPARSFSYDAAGNILTGSTSALSYTATYALENRLATMRVGNVTTRYAYDA